MKFLCRIGWHNWSLWSDIREEHWERNYFNNKIEITKHDVVKIVVSNSELSNE